MTEDMPGRMPEDMPVTKCINVMVGITRSKVILLWFFKLYTHDMGVMPRPSGQVFSIFFDR